MIRAAAFASAATHAAAAALIWTFLPAPTSIPDEQPIVVTLVEEQAPAPKPVEAQPTPSISPWEGENTPMAPPLPGGEGRGEGRQTLQDDASNATKAAPLPLTQPSPPGRGSRIKKPAPAEASAGAQTTMEAPPAAAPSPQDFVTASGGPAPGDAEVALGHPEPPAPPSWTLGSSGNPPPAYPPLARKRNWEGIVELAVEVAADGTSAEVVVQRSSGRDILDRAAVDAVKSWRFEPARAGGRAVRSRVVVPIRFRLTDDDR